MTKKIISTNKYEGGDSDDYFNEITTMLDTYLVDEWKKLTDKIGFSTYMMFRRKLGAAIRFPGATRGSVNFDENHIITEVMLYGDMKSIYKEGALEALKQYIGCELVVPEGVPNEEDN
jgi:hypothetical protein